MGGFSSIAPLAVSALQTGQQISAQKAQTRQATKTADQNRAAELADLRAEQQARAEDRAQQLKQDQATLRARQGASGLAAGGTGSARAVLSGLQRNLLEENATDAQTVARKTAEISRATEQRKQSLLSASRRDTINRINSWFATRYD